MAPEFPPEVHNRAPTPFPLAVADVLVRPLPPAFLQPAVNVALAAVLRRHPGMLARLDPPAGTEILIDPVDLSFCFRLRPNPACPVLRLSAGKDRGTATAVIRGPIGALLDLLQGRIDGDALFFSRRLRLEGDIEAIVGLRNAVDGEEIDLLGDLLSLLGPVAGPLRRVAAAAGSPMVSPARDNRLSRP